ncbi:MAG TPA: GNAT family N-acetyltransferase [Thermoanaerobaculia bacterium]
MRGGRLNRETLAAIERWAARERIECLYFLADSGDPETARLAEESGFRLVDLRVTLERRLGGSSGPASGAGRTVTATGRDAPTAEQAAAAAAVSSAGPPAAAAPAGGTAGAAAGEPETTMGPPLRVRPATGTDLPRLRRIAAASHRDSRFYHDRHFDRRRCDALYAGWIETSCADPAGVVLVATAAADPSASPAGYATAVIGEDGEGRIGLFAVAPDARGRGVGGALVAAVLDWLAGRGADPASVVTQGRNVRAQRLYQRFGMRTRSVELWFHRWWPPAEGER